MKYNSGYYWPDNMLLKDIICVLKQSCVLKAVLSNWPVIGGTVIQAGGSYGLWPKILANRFDLIYTFEPEPISFESLVKNCPEKNIIKFQLILSDESGYKSICRKRVSEHRVWPDGEVPNKSYVDKYRKQITKVKVITIDSLQLDNCTGIFLDVEGWEFHVLSGAQKTILKYHPIILAEGGENHGGDVKGLLSSLGYVQEKSFGSDDLYIYKGCYE